MLPNCDRARYAQRMSSSIDPTVSHAPVVVAHAIPGRLRLRLLGSEWTSERLDSLSADLEAMRARRGITDVELKRPARAVVIRYDPALLDQGDALGLADSAGLKQAASADAPGGAIGGKNESTEELAALIGIPTSFDRRLVESLALSGVSLFAAGRVGQALGGGMTLPAYFAIWFALRRLTGLGRRR